MYNFNSTLDSITENGENLQETIIENGWDADNTSKSGIDALIDDDLYDIQKKDVDGSLYSESGWTDPDDDGRKCRELSDEWYEDSDHVVESIDSLIDDEIYESQSNDVADTWSNAVNICRHDSTTNEANSNDM